MDVPDSAFVGYYPPRTVLWIWGEYDIWASDTSCFDSVAVGVAVTGKTTFCFLDGSDGAPLLRVLH